MRASLAKALGVPVDAILAELKDADAVARRLEVAEPGGVLLLRALVLSGGAASLTELAEYLNRFEAVELDLEWVASALLPFGCLHVTFGHRGDPGLMLLDEAAPTLAALLWPLVEPGDEAPVALPAGSAPARRLALALAGQLAHRPLRATRAGLPNKTSLKQFVKELPVATEEADQALRKLIDAEAVEEVDGAYVPLRDELVAGPASLGLHHRLQEWLREEGPQRLRTLVDAALLQVSVDYAARQCLFDLESHGLEGTLLKDVETYVRQMPGLGIHDGWAGLATRGGEADGFVTPAFDVMVGPGASDDALLVVAMAARLVSVGPLYTFHLEPRTVAGAARHGVGADELLGALASLTRHPLPDNVAGMVREGFHAAKVARVRREWLVEGDDARLAAALGEGARLVPGVFRALSLDEAQRALESEGVAIAHPTSREALDDRADPLPAGPTFEPKDPAGWVGRLMARTFTEPPRAVLGERLAKARRGELRWTSDAEEPCPKCGGYHGLGDPEGAAGPDDLYADSPLDPALIDELERLRQEIRGELTGFRKRLVPRERAHLDELFEERPLHLLPLLTLKAKWRRRALKKATTLDAMLDEATRLALPTRISEIGARLMDALVAARADSLQAPVAERFEALAKSGKAVALVLRSGSPLVGVVEGVKRTKGEVRVLFLADEEPRGRVVPLEAIEGFYLE